MSLKGTLIGESIRVGASIEGVPVTLDKLYRLPAGDQGSDQPLTWLFIAFTASEDQADQLATALSQALEVQFGWYCDFRSDDETFVVFADRIFRYPRGDQSGRSKAEAYARSVGVPEDQLDWPV